MSNIVLRDYQEKAVQDIREAFRKNNVVLFVLPTGGGKCAAAGTPVLMFDGTIRAIETVKPGELVMGPDSLPRFVSSVCSGREMMYRVTPTKGDPYVVNESHILSLKITGMSGRVKAGNGRMYSSGDIVNIGILDYLKSSSTFKHVAKGWRTGVDFPVVDNAEPLSIPPYVLGIWLGDGTEDRFAQLTNPDQEIIDAWCEWGESIGCDLRVRKQEHTECRTYNLVGRTSNGRAGGSNPALNALRSCGVFGRRHIPHAYKTSSRADRLELLAGIIDTDGYLHHGFFDVVAKSKEFAEDIAFVARSLGFACYVKPCQKTCTNTGAIGTYYRINICGNIDSIPCRVPRRKASPRRQIKDVLVTGISVEAIGVGDYYGFELDGPDHLFMLGDFTVTHNTYTFCYIGDSAALKGRRVMIIVHRKELLKQASKSLTKVGVEHGLIAPWATPKPRAMVQVASVDALSSKKGRALLSSGALRADLLIFDEGHHVQADNKWGAVFAALNEPKTLLVTASPGRPDFRGMGKGHGGIADVLVEGPSVPELIARGALIKPRVFGSTELPDIEGVKLNSEGDLNQNELAHRVDKPHLIGNAVREYTEVCPGARAVAFCVNVKHATHVRDAFNAAGYRFELLVGDKDLVSEAERTRIVAALDAGEIDGICTVDLVSEGFDCPGLACCIMLRPTHSEIVFLQQAGRVMRPEDGKDEAFLIDHAGNVGRWVDGEFKVKHGFPSTARDWSQCLEGKKRKPRGKKAVEPIVFPGMTQCKSCKTIFDVFDLKAEGKDDTHCPTCGEPVPIEHQAAQRMPKIVDGRLGELDPEIVEQQKKEARKEQGKAQTVEELRRNLGYSRGRANHVVQARKEKAELIDGLINDLRVWREETGQSPAEVLGVATFEIKAMKPKQLRELRTRLDDHLAVWRAVAGNHVREQATIDF